MGTAVHWLFAYPEHKVCGFLWCDGRALLVAALNVQQRRGDEDNNQPAGIHISDAGFLLQMSFHSKGSCCAAVADGLHGTASLPFEDAGLTCSMA